MILADDLKNEWPDNEIAGLWVLSKPIPLPLILRIRDAWKVLWGRAEAVEFVTEDLLKKKRCELRAQTLKKNQKSVDT